VNYKTPMRHLSYCYRFQFAEDFKTAQENSSNAKLAYLFEKKQGNLIFIIMSLIKLSETH